jgi:hypothetical protein
MALGQVAQAHNLYGQVLGEMGTMGALALLGVVACFALNAREMRRLSRMDNTGLGPFPKNLSRAIMISVALLLIKGWSDHNLYRYTWLWFGAFQAIAVNCMRERVARSHANQAGLPERPACGLRSGAMDRLKTPRQARHEEKSIQESRSTDGRIQESSVRDPLASGRHSDLHSLQLPASAGTWLPVHFRRPGR